MIKINLLPDHLCNPKSKVLRSGGPAIPREIIFGVGGMVFLALLVIHIGLALLTMGRAIEYKGVNSKWESMGSDKKIFDDLFSRIRVLQDQNKQLANLTKNESIIWPEQLAVISNSLPRGVWIEHIYYKDNLLTITGNAVSKSKDEMISVGNFATRLKNSEVLMKYFIDVEVGSIERQEHDNSLGVATFTLLIKGQDEPTPGT